MRIAIDIGPIDVSSNSQHKIRGVGKYITLLRDNITRYDGKNEYIFTSNPQSLKKIPDLIHFPYFDPFFVTLPYRKKTKTIVTVHDVIPLVHKKQFPSGLKGNIRWRINKIRLKNVDRIITDSKASMSDISRVVGLPSEKISVVYLSVDEEFRTLDDGAKVAAIRRKFGLPAKFLLYVGDVTWNKNLPRLVAAVKKANIPLVMVGKALTDKYDETNPWNYDRNKVVNAVGSDPLFLRLGFVPTEDLVGIYNLATALCMPSLDEGFGLPALEAMRCGCPVISSKMGSLPEVGGNAVLYVDAENIESITDGILAVFGNSSLRLDLSQKGLSKASEFTLEKFITDTIAIYERVYQDEGAH